MKVKDIQVLFIVLNEVDYLNDILEGFVNIGVSGATILDSQGMASLIVSSSNQNISYLRLPKIHLRRLPSL